MADYAFLDPFSPPHGSLDPWITGALYACIPGLLNSWIHGSLAPWVHGSRPRTWGRQGRGAGWVGESGAVGEGVSHTQRTQLWHMCACGYACTYACMRGCYCVHICSHACIHAHMPPRISHRIGCIMSIRRPMLRRIIFSRRSIKTRCINIPVLMPDRYTYTGQCM